MARSISGMNPYIGEMMTRIAAMALCAAFALPSMAEAACGSRVRIGSGETVSSIARKCGVNVERLRQANPGINDRNFQRGTYLSVPRPALPSQQQRVFGNDGLVRQAPQPPIGQGIVIPGIEKIQPR